MADLIDREKLRDALYDADAITFKGLAILNTFPVAAKIEKLQKQIKALQKSNRNWRRKCQRLRNPIETTCEGCMWANRKRPQKCACCRRNSNMKDCYEEERENNETD